MKTQWGKVKHLLAGGNDLVWRQEKAIHPRVSQLHPVAEENDGDGGVSQKILIFHSAQLFNQAN